jgi:glycerol uptake facilitator-like aquaporin
VSRRMLVAEMLGGGILLYVVVGSGIALDRPGSGPTTVLSAHALAVGLCLVVLVLILKPISGAHFNPAVTLAMWSRRQLDLATALAFIAVQTVGACFGAVAANLSFGLEAVQLSTLPRGGLGLWLAEFIVTLMLVVAISSLTADRGLVALVVGAWMAAAVMATASAGFGNPAATIARTLTNSYSGISPGSVLPFVAAQLAGGLVGAWFTGVLIDSKRPLSKGKDEAYDTSHLT